MKSYIYFIQAGKSGPIKIGKANNIQQRLATFQTAHVDTLQLLGQIDCKSEADAFIVEKTLHRKFKKYHIRGEWFEDTPQVRAAIHRGAKIGYLENLVRGIIYVITRILWG
jgi:hypothetical protein